MRAAGARAARTAALAIAVASAGCSEDFLPASYLRDLRVLAVLADPLEVGPGEPLAARAVIYVPPGAAVATASWSFCPFGAGAASGYACAAPQCETALAPAPDGSVAAVPSDLALRCAASLGGAPPPGVPPEVPEELPSFLRLVVTGSAGERREVVQPVPLWTRAAPAERNLPPRIQAVEIGGLPAAPDAPGAVSLRAGGSLPVRVLVAPESVQTYLDASGRRVEEAVVVSYFTTAGRFEKERTDGVDGANALEGKELLPGETEARLYVVARDLRGGQDVRGPFLVPIAP